jgi:hypothetical protein
MPVPTTEQLLHWAEKYVETWNTGDKAGFEANWRAVAPGDFRMLDPVGTPEKRGFKECCLDPFDLFQPRLRFRIQPGTLFVCGNEVAWVMENHFTTDGDRSTVVLSIETYRFEPDGSAVLRTYYNVPDHGDGELGEIFQTYLP